MDIRTDGRAYGIIYVRTYGWTDRLSNYVGRMCVRNYVRMYLRADGRADIQTSRLSRLVGWWTDGRTNI